MLTRLEATYYRCFERLAIDVGQYQVLVGANGTGKTTLLDLPVLLGDLLRANNIALPFMEKRSHLPPRAGSLNELVFANRGNDFSFAVEARMPQAVQEKVLEGMCLRMKSEKSRLALREASKQWPTHIRYEIGLRVSSDSGLHVINEYLFVFPEAFGPDRQMADFFGATAESNKHWRRIIKREIGHDVEFSRERASGRARKVGLAPTLLALSRVLYESEAEYPAARWLHDMLTADAVFFEPNWADVRLASPPGLPKKITADGRNMPWLALALKREGMPLVGAVDYRSEAYCDWLAHVQTALPQVIDIDVREREDDHHAYFLLTYRGDFKVPSIDLSEGTLRILCLTLLPWLSRQPAIFATEEPENGIHPQAITAVLQALSSVYDSQVFVSSHSPLVLAETQLSQLLCARQTSSGGVEVMAGDQHPHLQSWKGGISLGTLFAAGVLS